MTERAPMPPSLRWEAHCKKAHPKPPWSCVRNMLGTRVMCCTADCTREWKPLRREA